MQIENNNNIFDTISEKMGVNYDYAKTIGSQFAGFDKVKYIFLQYIYQDEDDSLSPKVSEPLFFIRMKYVKFGMLTQKSVDDFNKVQRLYHILLRFVNLCKMRRYKVYDSDEDLCMVPFSSIDPRKIVRLLHNKCIYKFNINDLINIIHTSLTNQHFMLPSPVMPKNPYTNLEFKRHHIINIFVKMWDLKIKMRPILYYFFQCNFSIPVFKNRNRVLLCDMAIDSYLSKESTVSPDVIMDIISLLQLYSNPFMQVNVHPNFPSKVLYAIFRPYLKLYYKMKLLKCSVYEEKLRHALCCFSLFNPYFGKKYYRPDSSTAFDDRHLNYNDFTEGAFYELRKMSVFEIIQKYKHDTNNMFSVSIGPIKNVTYVFNSSIIQYPNLITSDSEEEEEEEPKIEEEEEEEEEESKIEEEEEEEEDDRDS